MADNRRRKKRRKKKKSRKIVLFVFEILLLAILLVAAYFIGMVNRVKYENMSETEVIGPIQMGLNKPIHFTDIESSVRDIVNITAIACIDAIVDKKKKAQ